MDMHFEGVIFQTHAAELHRRLAFPHPPFRILDVRPAEQWAAGHIPGAVTLAPAGRAPGLPAGADARTELFIVGEDPDDPAVRASSLALKALGARRLVEVPGGMAEWRDLGYPIETAERPSTQAA